MPGLSMAAAAGRRPDLAPAYQWFSRQVTVAALIAIALMLGEPGRFPAGWIWLVVACICGAAVTAWRFPHGPPMDARCRALAWIGPIFFAIAAGADIAATLWHSPTLDLEGNPLVRALLARLPLGWVLAGAGLFQLAVLSLSVSLWRNLLARWPWYLDEQRARGRVPLGLSMLGVRPGSWSRRLMLGTHADLAVTASAFLLPWAYLGRLYLAMEWMGWVPISRWLMPGALMVLALLFQWWIVRRALAGSAVPEAAPAQARIGRRA